jgi:hypothetical protein
VLRQVVSATLLSPCVLLRRAEALPERGPNDAIDPNPDILWGLRAVYVVCWLEPEIAQSRL